MSKLLVTTIALFFLVFQSIEAFSQVTQKSVDRVLSEIRQEQGVTNGNGITVSIVSAPQAQRLGNAVLADMINNPELHDQMSKAMGGEGSAPLAAMYEKVGRNYLSGNLMLPMHSGMGLMGTSSGNERFARGGQSVGWNFPGMMGGACWGFGGMLMGLIFLLLVIVVTYFVVRAASRRGALNAEEPPSEILKRRYAKGEISKEDFEKMKKDL